VENLYRERILDHYRHPRNRGTLEGADISCERDNPVCGDVVRLDIRLSGGRVSEVRFSGRGCVISMASASMLTEEIVGKTVEEMRALQDEDVFRMLGITLGPVRAKCGLLPLRVLQEGLAGMGGPNPPTPFPTREGGEEPNPPVSFPAGGEGAS
jgi:nitrogen fixation NifU-like protein